jgi:hypothetical protein
MEFAALDGLTAAFEDWRSKKGHPREAVPAALLERARAAAREHGPAAVARATKVDRGRLKTGLRSRARRAMVPAFTRVEVAASAGTTAAFAEVETPTGLKVRLFTQSDEAVGLLSSLLGMGGAR